MDEHFNQKVYINPSFNRTGSYLNKNFTHQMPQVKPNNQRKIFVNPSFINKSHVSFQQKNSHQQDNAFHTKSLFAHQNEPFNAITQDHVTLNTKQTCYRNHSPENINFKFNNNKQAIINSQYNSNTEVTILKDQNNLTNQIKNDNLKLTVCPLVKSRYRLVNNKSTSQMAKPLQSNQIDNTIRQSYSPLLQANYKCQKLHIAKSKYCVIRNNKPVSPSIKSIKKSCTIKISKYKIISAKNFNTVPKSQLQTVQNAINKISTVNSNKPTAVKFTISPSAVIIHNTSKNRNKYKTHNYTNVSSEINSLNTKRNYNFITKKYLKGSFKINNIPCPLYTKYGKCLRKDKGNCEYLHDKKHVSLCRRFLKGICHNIDCLLSHELSDKKMPTCYFYLNGLCTKEHCPYMHIKLSEKTKLCQDFLKGYCEKGNKCLLRHVKKHHPMGMSGSSLNRSGRLMTHNCTKRSKNKPKIVDPSPKYTVHESLNDKSGLEGRYYKDVGTEENQQCEIIKPLRCKLGTLPSYIQLE